VEKHTGGSVIAGATAAAATSIVTAPYYAGVAAVDAGGKVVDYAKDKSRHLPGASAGPADGPSAERGGRGRMTEADIAEHVAMGHLMGHLPEPARHRT
jgi:hypothetical protein